MHPNARLSGSSEAIARPNSLADVDTAHPVISVDLVIFSVFERDLKVLLVRRMSEPFQDQYALPGGRIDIQEGLEDAASRVLDERLGVRGLFFEQLGAFGDPLRDPRARIVTIAYYALVPSHSLDAQLSERGGRAQWHSVYNLPKLAFDHERIQASALARLRERIEQSAIGFELLPAKFTLSELQFLHETILGRSLDKRNFRRKMQLLGILEPLSERRMDGIHRPAQLFSYRLPAASASTPHAIPVAGPRMGQ